MHNQAAKLNVRPNDKFVVTSKENPIHVIKDDAKKICLEDDLIDIGSSYAATCNRSCHMDPSVLQAEFTFRFFDMEKEIEKAKKIDDLSGEREAITLRIKKDLEEEKASIVTDFLKKFPKVDHFKDLFDDFNDLLVLPDTHTPVTKTVKPKPSKFQIFEDDAPAFVPAVPKKNKLAFALRRL